MEKRHGSPTFYALLEQMAEIHNKKSHDYAVDGDPFVNYHFAGKMAHLFNDERDSGFVGRLGEKIIRLATLENSNKTPKNESVADTEVDICVIVTLWMASRKDRRSKEMLKEATQSVDSNPNRDTACWFCGKHVEAVAKIISGQYRQAHISCYEQATFAQQTSFVSPPNAIMTGFAEAPGQLEREV